MAEILKKYWPESLPVQIDYRLGKEPLHQYLKQHAKNMPDQTAYHYYGAQITWRQLDRHVDRFAQFLRTQGIEKGDRVGLYMQNCPQYIIAHYAAQRIGGIVAPLNPMYKEAELSFLIQEGGISAIVAGEELLENLQNSEGQMPDLRFVVTTNYSDFLPAEPVLALPPECSVPKKRQGDPFDLAEILNGADLLEEDAKIDLDNDPALMLFTSGTTGRPKAALLSFGNALFKTAATVEAYGIAKDERMLAVAPLCHIAGMVMGVNMPVYTGCECVLLTRFIPQTAVDAIEQHRITSWYSIAPMNAAILAIPEIEKRDWSSLKTNMATSFGIAVTEELAQRWSGMTGGCSLFEAAYGLSETHTCDTFMPKDRIKYGSCGIATYETEIRIIDPVTEEVMEAGQQGEILVKNPGVFMGYFNRPDATAETLRNGWVHTGDVGKLDDEGYLYFLGRTKEMIKSSGYSVFPEDVEALLNQHPAVLQSAVIGIPDAVRGESVKAFIVLKPDLKGTISEQEIMEWAKGYMSAYKTPREIVFLGQLPATSSGKILRRLLKEDQEG